MIINTEGIIIRMKCDGISELGRVTSGVKLINLPEGRKSSLYLQKYVEAMNRR